jgi:hypothetical protein
VSDPVVARGGESWALFLGLGFENPFDSSFDLNKPTSLSSSLCRGELLDS